MTTPCSGHAAHLALLLLMAGALGEVLAVALVHWVGSMFARLVRVRGGGLADGQLEQMEDGLDDWATRWAS